MKRIFTFLTLLALMAVAVSSCGNKKHKALLPNVSGKAGEVIVVLNKYDWEGEVGNRLRTLLASDCPFLPQKEPLYTLVNIAPIDFTNIFQIHRNIVLINIDKETKDAKVTYRTDVWAKPQCVINMQAQSTEAALELLEKEGQTILTMLEQAERDRVIANSKKYEETSLRPVVYEFAGGSPYFPTGYVLKKKTEDFLWISYDTQYTTQGIFVYKYPVSAKDEFSPERIINKRNEVLKENVPGMFENTYMTTSDVTTPSVEYLKYRGRDFAQMRGFWEVANDYMGGPFVSHSFYSQNGKEVIVLEGFVYAPKYDKRTYLRQVEAIIYSFEWKVNDKK